MPRFSSYEPGTFCWTDLVTKDAPAAKRFYSELLGWTFDDLPGAPPGAAMCKLNGESVAAILPVASHPPTWNSYISVEDIEATAQKAVASGGQVIQPPFDAGDSGRAAVIADPAGAHVCLWQAKSHVGAGLKSEIGALCWNELYTTNVDASAKFYLTVFGWQAETANQGPAGPYTSFRRAGKGKEGNFAGMLALPEGMKNLPSHWIPYFLVANTDGATKKATALGAKVIVPPTDIPKTGRFTMLHDPQGASLALFHMLH